MGELVSPARRQLEVDVAVGESGKVSRQVEELLGDEMDDVALPLDAAVDRHHARFENDTTPLLEQRGPDHDVGRAGLVLDGDEHDALGRARLLAHKHETGGVDP